MRRSRVCRVQTGRSCKLMLASVRTLWCAPLGQGCYATCSSGSSNSTVTRPTAAPSQSFEGFSGMKRFAGLFVAVFALLGVLVTPANAATYDAKVLQFNMCGQSCRNGAVEPSVTAIANTILNFRPDFVSLNEACANQVTALRDTLAARGYAMTLRFGFTKPGGCTGGANYGNALYSRGAVLDESIVYQYPTQTSNVEFRKLLCIRANYALSYQRARVCTTHLLPNAADMPSSPARAQVRELANFILPWTNAGTPLIIAGDFNMTAGNPGLDPLYTSSYGVGSSGRFVEVDICPGPNPRNRLSTSCNESTRGNFKYDYIFGSDYNHAVVDGDATTTNVSDHEPLRGVLRRTY